MVPMLTVCPETHSLSMPSKDLLSDVMIHGIQWGEKTARWSLNNS